MTSPRYCAPCIADLALVREAVTTVSGTAVCMAHAVLLTHSTDDPGRRRQRLDALKDLATGKAETAEPAEQVKLELLVQEYGLAGAMDMGGPSRRQPQGLHQGQPRQGTPSAPGEGRKSRRGRVRPDRAHGEPGGDGGQGQGGQGQGQGPGGQGQNGPRGEQRDRGQRPPRGERRPGEGGPVAEGASPGGGPTGETAPVTPAPGPAGEGVDGQRAVSLPAASSPSEAPSEASPRPEPSQSPAETSSTSPTADAAPQSERPASAEPAAPPPPAPPQQSAADAAPAAPPAPPQQSAADAAPAAPPAPPQQSAADAAPAPTSADGS